MMWISSAIMPFLLILVSFVGAFLQSNLGFGSALFIMNFLPMMVDSSKAFIICQMNSICLAILVLSKYHKDIRTDVLFPLLIPAVACTIVSTYSALGLQTDKIKILLGICFVILSIYFSLLASRIKFKPTTKSAMLIGFLSGIMNGIFSIGGPPAVLYLAPSLGKKEEYIATSQLYFLVLNLCSLVVRLISIRLDRVDALHILEGSIGVTLGVFIGLLIGKRLNATFIKRLVYIVVGLNGILLIIRNI